MEAVFPIRVCATVDLIAWKEKMKATSVPLMLLFLLPESVPLISSCALTDPAFPKFSCAMAFGSVKMVRYN